MKTDGRGPFPPDVGVGGVSPAHFEAADEAAVATRFLGATRPLVCV